MNKYASDFQLTLKEKILQLGFSDNEARIYSAILELGGAFPSAIAQAAKMNRSTAYAVLTGLANKGLVMEMRRNNQIYYQIEQPNRIVRYAKNRIHYAEKQLEKAELLLPILDGLYSAIPQKPRMRFFEGFPEVLSVHEDHLMGDEKYEMLAWANADQVAGFLPTKLKNWYLKKKQRLGISTRAIVPDTPKDRKYNERVYGIAAKKIWPKLRFVPASDFPYPAEITIYGKNKVSILNFSKDTPIGLIIEDKMIHDLLIMIFELSWKGANK